MSDPIVIAGAKRTPMAGFQGEFTALTAPQSQLKGTKNEVGQFTGRGRVFNLKNSFTPKLKFIELQWVLKRFSGPGTMFELSRFTHNGRLASLDLLRLMSALMVVFYHYLYRGNVGEPQLMQTGFLDVGTLPIYGILGLNLFFIISGFVIAWSAEGRTMVQFAAARAVRIYPGFVVCMTITFLVMALADHPAFQVSIQQFVANLFIFSPALGQPFMDGVYWTIVFELIFYGYVALFIAFGLFQTRLVSLCAAWLLLALVNESFLHIPALRVIFLTQYIPYFVSGMVLYKMAKDGISFNAGLIWILAVLQSIHSMEGLRVELLVDYGLTVGPWPMLVANVATHFIFIATLFAGRFIPASKTVLLLGGMTYPLYLLHQQIGYVAIDYLSALSSRWIALLIVVGGALLLSGLIWRWVEKPLQSRLKPIVNQKIPALFSAIFTVPRSDRFPNP